MICGQVGGEMKEVGLMIKSIWWRLRVLGFALRRARALNIGDAVEYEGREWRLSQGVSAPIWTLRCGDESVVAHEKELRKLSTLSNYWQSFLSAYRFYMLNWHSIWVAKGIEPWMRGCRIW